MALGLQPAGWIDRQRAVLGDGSVGDDACALPFGREAHGFVFDQFGDGEAVVHLGERQIRKLDAGLLERALPRHRAAFEFENVAP